MITAILNSPEDSFSLVIRGHAGYNCKGSDIVCAGVSALSQAFLASMKKLERHKCIGRLSVNISDGFLSVDGAEYRDRDAHCRVKAYVTMLREGISAIASSYSDYVTLLSDDNAPFGELSDTDTSESTMTRKAGERNGI